MLFRNGNFHSRLSLGRIARRQALVVNRTQAVICSKHKTSSPVESRTVSRSPFCVGEVTLLVAAMKHKIEPHSCHARLRTLQVPGVSWAGRVCHPVRELTHGGSSASRADMSWHASKQASCVRCKIISQLVSIHGQLSVQKQGSARLFNRPGILVGLGQLPVQGASSLAWRAVYLPAFEKFKVFWCMMSSVQ